ncbi:MAG: hypothetical protein LKI25_00625 [Atopobiaceae bacterium]|jgi:hypothetical protein|nr:hypothetical protein [Atopobiaceae bacterium]MCI2172717.1 hypothetical protein [Atopobiaceae bacterium]MCI2207024.1 hypothetical protein [Atopobiaceae bacterium]
MSIAAFVIIAAVIIAVGSLVGVALAGDDVDFVALSGASNQPGILDDSSSLITL